MKKFFSPTLLVYAIAIFGSLSLSAAEKSFFPENIEKQIELSRQAFANLRDSAGTYKVKDYIMNGQSMKSAAIYPESRITVISDKLVMISDDTTRVYVLFEWVQEKRGEPPYVQMTQMFERSPTESFRTKLVGASNGFKYVQAAKAYLDKSADAEQKRKDSSVEEFKRLQAYAKQLGKELKETDVVKDGLYVFDSKSGEFSAEIEIDSGLAAGAEKLLSMKVIYAK